MARYEREAPRELLHVDTKKLGRIVRPSHRVTGDRRDSVDGAGWEFAHVAINDHSRVSFVQMHANERKDSAVNFLLAAVAHYESFNGRLRDEFLNVNEFFTMQDARAKLKAWQQDCNHHRPHSSLGDLTSSEFVGKRSDQQLESRPTPV